MRLVRVMISVIWVLLFSASAHARLLLIESQDSPVYQAFQQGMLGVLNSPEAETLEVRLASDVAELELAPYSAIIVAGVDAAKALAGRDTLNRPLLYTMLPLSSYEWLSANGLLAPNHKLLHIDQPVSRYMQLVRAAMPEIATLGYLYGEASAVYIEEFKKAAAIAKLDTVQGGLAGRERPASLFKDTFTESDAVLLLPDPFFYNRRVLQELLLASFRYKRPLVVYSESFLKAGAMLALFSTPEQLGRQAAEIANCLARPCYGAVAERAAPKYFSVMVNEVVSRQMGIATKSEAELQQYLESLDPPKLRQ